ncbi:MAG: molecular chaperone TorD family protein [Cocleimonas sp.]
MSQTQVTQTKSDRYVDNCDESSVSHLHVADNQKIEQQYRASAYSILAALLRGVPTLEILKHVAEFSKVEVDEDELLLSMSTLGLAAKSSDLSAINDEYHELFIGLGKGELVPYGSWYLTGYLMEQPLSVLRDDLKILGFERDEKVVEPEDHVAALCEVMSFLITQEIEEESDVTQQAIFFEKHIQPWMGTFYDDVSKAESAVFYRAVGRFGCAFINLEKQYLLP